MKNHLASLSGPDLSSPYLSSLSGPKLLSTKVLLVIYSAFPTSRTGLLVLEANTPSRISSSCSINKYQRPQSFTKIM
ncbi:hypothetical protein BRARA_G01402 [Brassica rapa]|uniref:Uncharacterized protein n=1 Tax=Brassica campestris TaxID=3711 RepID=A0A397YKT5_BRACM|nr:hypothetical protein BRARA_G01402 [Brassica rapa]